MAKSCPIVNRAVIYQFCQDCDDKPCLTSACPNQTTFTNFHHSKCRIKEMESDNYEIPDNGT